MTLLRQFDSALHPTTLRSKEGLNTTDVRMQVRVLQGSQVLNRFGSLESFAYL